MTARFLLAVLACLLAPGMAAAQAQPFQEGEHYTRLPTPLKTADPGRIEVTEYFSYGCPHCFRFEPLINRWKSSLPADVVFNRTPAVWNPSYQFLAQTYYTLDIMGVLEAVHLPIFKGLHQERRQIMEAKAMARFLAEHGISAAAFSRAFASFGVRHATLKAEARGRAYHARGVPALIVNGKYLVESGAQSGLAGMLEVADYLIGRERADLAEQALLEGGANRN